MAEIITLGPVAYNPMGAYNSETEYERLDVVLYNDVSYVAKQNVQGQLPTNTDYWDALGISGADMSNYYTKSEVDTEVNAKYTKPNSGIPKTDLSSSVQTSLDLADSALQSHQDISGKEDKTNKVTSISSSSTDNQYVSAKCVYDYIEEKIGSIETILEELDIGGGV
jgi:hypothetical protein